ncbi:MAG TPA: hypothetical protein VFS05_03610 [Gemmatimonadaceae bacterium]|nr:hypothetical protein [Gemmatimonadaceae bacterium]
MRTAEPGTAAMMTRRDAAPRSIVGQVMLTPSTSFDPIAPLPPRTLATIMATGAGQAASTRLQRCAVYALLGALAIVVVAPRWWLASMPLIAAGAFGIYGLATQRRYELDAEQQRAPVLRAALQASRGAAIIAALVAAGLGIIGLVLALLTPRQLLP